MQNKKWFPLGLILLCFACSKGPKIKEASQDAYPLSKDAIVFEGTGKRGGTLVLSAAGNPKTLNPLVATDTTSIDLLRPINATLINVDLDTLEYSYPLLKSKEISEDNKIYTFKIREGIRWSDGRPFTVDDILFTYQVLTDPKLPLDLKSTFEQRDKSFPKLKKIDEETIRFTLEDISVLFEAALSNMEILPKHRWEESYKNGTFMNEMLISMDTATFPSLGPYILDKIVPDQRIIYRRNPYYYVVDKSGTRLPYFDRVVRIITPDNNAMLIKFQNGETDMHEVKADQYDLIARNAEKEDYTLFDIGASYTSYWFQVNQNTGKDKDGNPYVDPEKLKFFQDPQFKKALSHATDRKGMIKTVFYERATPLYSITPPADKTWSHPNLKTYPFDLETSRKLLDELGLKDTDGDGIREFPGGKPIRLVMKTNTETNQRVQIGNILKEDFKKVGIDVNYQLVPFNNFISTLMDSFDYDIALLGWGSGIPPDPSEGRNVVLSNGRLHAWNPNQQTPVHVWEKQVDDLMYKNMSTMDLQERQKYWHQILEIWGEELPQIFILTPNVYLAARNKIGNVRPTAFMPYYAWNVEELYDKKLESKEIDL